MPSGGVKKYALEALKHRLTPGISTFEKGILLVEIFPSLTSCNVVRIWVENFLIMNMDKYRIPPALIR
jgi:hypothetical protein